MGILIKDPPKSSLSELREVHVNRLLNLEDAMRDNLVLDDVEELTTHWHCEGSYVREFFLPKDHMVTGEIHRYACINILLTGKVKVVQSDGASVIEAPHIYISEPGEKKALYALEDSRFLNVHATHETDQDVLRKHFTVPASEFLLEEK